MLLRLDEKVGRAGRFGRPDQPVLQRPRLRGLHEQGGHTARAARASQPHLGGLRVSSMGGWNMHKNKKKSILGQPNILFQYKTLQD